MHLRIHNRKRTTKRERERERERGKQYTQQKRRFTKGVYSHNVLHGEIVRGGQGGEY